MKLRRIELVGDISEFSEPLPGRSGVTREDYRLDAEKAAARFLSQRGRMMLELRRVGFEWKEIAGMLKTTDTTAAADFSREVRKARLKHLSARAGHRESGGCPKADREARPE